MPTELEIQHLPRLEHRAPATAGVIDDPSLIEAFRESLFALSGVRTPTVLLVNLEGRYLTVSALYQLVLPLGQIVRSRQYGDISVVFASPDQATRESIRALAETYQVPLFVAPGAERLNEAEAVGPLTAGEIETIALMRRLGGRVTVSQVAEAAGLDPPAAANRLNAIVGKSFAHRVERPKSAGHLYIAPWVALPEDPADPTSGDFDVPVDVREDVRALAELQGRAPDELVAEAVRNFMDQHRERLEADYERVSKMLHEGDKEGVAEHSTRFAKKSARAHVRRRDTPK